MGGGGGSYRWGEETVGRHYGDKSACLSVCLSVGNGAGSDLDSFSQSFRFVLPNVSRCLGFLNNRRRLRVWGLDRLERR